MHARLAATSNSERMVFGAGVAERLMRAHEALSREEQYDFTLSLRPLLEAVWEAALGDDTMYGKVKQALGTFYHSDYCHNDELRHSRLRLSIDTTDRLRATLRPTLSRIRDENPGDV